MSKYATPQKTPTHPDLAGTAAAGVKGDEPSPAPGAGAVPSTDGQRAPSSEAVVTKRYSSNTPQVPEGGRRQSLSSSLDSMLDLEHLQQGLGNTLTRKERVWALMDDPSSSRAAYYVSILIMFLIAVSCVNFVVETLPSIQQSCGSMLVLEAIEMFCSILFTVEYVLRFFSAPHKWLFFKGPLNLVDLLAILPWYIEIFSRTPFQCGGDDGTSASFVRIIRLVRVFRVLKVSRYLTWVRLFAAALGKSAQPLGMLLFIIAIAMIFFSSIMFTAEKGVWSGEPDNMWVMADDTSTPSPFQSIPDTFYWCIITMTTVGYGDVYPVTWVGQIIAVTASLCGILVLAIPITVISTNFNAEYEQLQKQQQIIRARMLLLKQHFAQRRTGMDALQSEIREMGKRSTSELMAEVHKIVEKSQEVLCEELEEIVRVAYTERQKELEKAGFDSEMAAARHITEQAKLAEQAARATAEIHPKHNHTHFRQAADSEKEQ